MKAERPAAPPGTGGWGVRRARGLPPSTCPATDRPKGVAGRRKCPAARNKKTVAPAWRHYRTPRQSRRGGERRAPPARAMAAAVGGGRGAQLRSSGGRSPRSTRKSGPRREVGECSEWQARHTRPERPRAKRVVKRAAPGCDW